MNTSRFRVLIVAACCAAASVRVAHAQETLNFASVRSGVLTPPVTGAFDDKGRGTFYGVDTVDDRTVLVRFVISDVTPNSARFEQAFSADGGATWETNWIAVDTKS